MDKQDGQDKELKHATKSVYKMALLLVLLQKGLSRCSGIGKDFNHRWTELSGSFIPSFYPVDPVHPCE
jgi:hypothetical protein